MRRLHAAEGELVEDGTDDSAESQSAEQLVAYHEYVVLDYAGRLQIPREYLDQLGISDRAQVELTDDGILVKPAVGLDDTASQVARSSEVAESWGPQARSKDWRLRIGDASRGLRGLFGKQKK